MRMQPPMLGALQWETGEYPTYPQCRQGDPDELPTGWLALNQPIKLQNYGHTWNISTAATVDQAFLCMKDIPSQFPLNGKLYIY